MSTTSEKDPAAVALGKRGAAKRWGGRRILRLDTLSEPVRAAIEAMVSAEAAARSREAAKKAPAAAESASAQEVRRASVDHRQTAE